MSGENQTLVDNILKSKLIFVDFDGTICLHLVPVNYRQSEIWNIDTEAAYQAVFKNSIPNKYLIHFLAHAQSNGAKIVLLSSASSKALEMKDKWLDRHCHGLFSECIAVQSHEEKIACAEAYIAMRAKYPGAKQTALMIDDSSDVLRKAHQCGIMAASPSTITEIYEH